MRRSCIHTHTQDDVVIEKWSVKPMISGVGSVRESIRTPLMFYNDFDNIGRHFIGYRSNCRGLHKIVHIAAFDL